MSFKCEECNVPQELGAKPHKVVLQTRDKIYPVRHRNNDPKDVVIDNGGRGIEIVKEADLCDVCVLNHMTIRANS